MPIWSEVLGELSATADGDKPPAFDPVRRKYLAALHEFTERDTILYASAWIQKPDVSAGIGIDDEDIQGLMEVTQGLRGDKLDLILHSPGGSLVAAEAIVSYLRSRFSNIRVIVPNLAMSAATMVACAADEVVLGKHSFLGPTDPQFLLSTPLGRRWVPAHAILSQFRQAQTDSTDPAKLAAWLPMLSQYGPDLLVRCRVALQLSKELVATWLEKYMLAGPGTEDRADDIAEWLADHNSLKSHARHIPRDDLRSRGMTVRDLENDDKFQDLVLSVFHATTHTFMGTSAVKIIENHRGRAFVKQSIGQPTPPGAGLAHLG